MLLESRAPEGRMARLGEGVTRVLTPSHYARPFSAGLRRTFCGLSLYRAHKRDNSSNIRGIGVRWIVSGKRKAT